MPQKAERVIKPLAHANYTMFSNDLLDYVLPKLSPSAWKLLSILIRGTVGYKDDATETGRREKVWFTYSELQRRSGMARDTIARAMRELRGVEQLRDQRGRVTGEKETGGPRYVNRQPKPLLHEATGTRQQSYIYSLNRQLEMRVSIRNKEPTDKVVDEPV